MVNQPWFALSIGNSRLHWAKFEDNVLVEAWDSPHLTQIPEWDTEAELWIASVVSAQSQFWKTYQTVQWIELNQVNLGATYPTLGLDRALALSGAIARYGAPVLVIDCGTALTFTGSDARSQLVGGAILPGLKLQFQALGQSTAALPQLEPHTLSAAPDRWARTTDTAIQSGILYTVLAGIRSFITDWHKQMGQSAIVLTGGDAPLLYPLLRDRVDAIDPILIFAGMATVRAARQLLSPL
jgi:type III pantothenate kinase